jgi:hypothetical protein
MLVWRVTRDAPLGEWIDARTIPGDLDTGDELPEVTLGTWASSSFDLLHGADVSESPDTVPGDLLDELFGPLVTPGKTREK